MLIMRVDAIDRGIGGTFTRIELPIGQRAARFRVLLCFWRTVRAYLRQANNVRAAQAQVN